LTCSAVFGGFRYGIGKATGVTAVPETEKPTASFYDTVVKLKSGGFSEDDIRKMAEEKYGFVPDGMEDAIDQLY